MIYCVKRFSWAVAVCLISLSGATLADAEATGYYEDALSRFASGDNQGALIQLKNMLQRDPSQLPGRMLLAKVQMKLGDFLAAEKELLMAERMGGDPRQLVVLLAEVRNELKKFETNVKELNPNDYPIQIRAELWTYLGIALLHTDDIPAARVAFDNALKFAPDHPQAHVGLARIPLKEGNLAEATKLAEQALGLYPHEPEVWYLHGAVAHSRGEYEEAIASYNRVLTLEPGHLQASLGAATATLDSGWYDGAAQLFSEFTASYPNHPEAFYLLSQAYENLGRASDAKAALDKATTILSSIAPEDLQRNAAYLMLGALIAIDNKQPEMANRYLTLFLNKQPGDVKARKLQAATLLKLRKPLLASRTLLPLVTSPEVDASVFIMLGDTSVQLNEYENAERYYEQALQLGANPQKIARKIGFAQFGSGRVDQAIATFARQRASGRATMFLGMLYFSERRLEAARAEADRVLAEQPRNPIALNLKGAVALAQGELSEARRIFEGVLARNTEFRPARFNLAKLESIEGNFAAAQRILNNFLAANPADKRALHELARIHLRTGDRRAAAQALETIRKSDGKALLPIIELIDLYRLDGRTQEAERIAQSLLAKLPDNVLALHALAKVQLVAGEKGFAQDTLKLAFNNAGYDSELLTITGNLQIEAAAYDDAYWSLSRAVQERPNSVGARNAFAGLLYRQKKYDEAVNQLNLVRELDPSNQYSLALLADVALTRKAYPRAIDMYEQAYALRPSVPVAISLYQALESAGQHEQALQRLTGWREAYPNSAPILRLLAERYQRDGESRKAWDAYEQLLVLTPDDGIAFNNFAVMLADLDNERSLRMARRAYELLPGHPAVLDTLGWALIQLGELDEGLSHLRDAVARNSNSPTLRYHLAVGLQEYGKEAEARVQFETALTMNRDFSDKTKAIERLEYLKEKH